MKDQTGPSAGQSAQQSAAQPAKPDLSVEVRVREAGEVQADTQTDAVAFANPAATPLATRKTESWAVRAAVLAVVLAVAGIYTGLHIGRGWVPADDGTLGQSALHVMQGQLPHRDFGEIYTGGLSFIHALALRVFGVNLMSLRICVFLFFLAWIPAVYYIALRFIRIIRPRCPRGTTCFSRRSARRPCCATSKSGRADGCSWPECAAEFPF
jgi:hypothetical protein